MGSPTAVPLSVATNHLESLLKHRFHGPTPKYSDSVGLGWSLQTWISSELPTDADGAILGAAHFVDCWSTK